MDTLKRALKVGQVIKDISTSIETSATLKEQITQALVSEEPIVWPTAIANAFANDTAIAAKLQGNLPVTEVYHVLMPAARRYHLCDQRYDDSTQSRQLPFYSQFVLQSQLDAIPDTNGLVTKTKDLYRNYLPHAKLLAGTVNSSAVAPAADADYPNARTTGLQVWSENDWGIELFKFNVAEESTDLMPKTKTAPVSWSNVGSCFTIDPTHDYIFGIDVNVLFTTNGEVALMEEGGSGISETDVTRQRKIAFTDPMGPCEVHLYARLHNGAEDDSANMLKLMPSFPSFVKLSEQHWPRVVDAGSATVEARCSRMQGGFRLRSVIDDYIEPGFMSTGATVATRPRFKYIDFIIAVRTQDVQGPSGVVHFRLHKKVVNGKDVSNFIDVVDLGAVL